LCVNPRGVDRDDLDQVFSLVPGQYGGTLSWLAHPAEGKRHTDGIGATEAIRLLERFKRESRPFFLAVGFYRPHTPYVAPKQYFERYPPERVALPALSDQDKVRRPAPAYASAKKEQDAMTDEQRREAIGAYWASITFMDAQVGRVLKALDRLKLSDSTVVVFTSDHGYHLADHGLWQKMSLFERSARVPLIIAVPRSSSAGRSAPGVVEMVDLYPTLAALCGLEAPDYLDGTSLVPMLRDPTARVKQAAMTQVRRGNWQGRSVRTERWRYTEWDGGRRGVELYDMQEDPGESHNLADEPDRSEVMQELKSLIKD